MTSAFKHPLARDAKVWQTDGIKGEASRVLVVVTTLQLDKGQKNYKAEKLKRLSDAAREWVKEHPAEASDVMLISRPKEWSGDNA